MSLIALSLVGCTVHFWNVLYAFFFFFIGMSGWIADPAAQAGRGEGQAEALRAVRCTCRPRAHVPHNGPQPRAWHSGPWPVDAAGLSRRTATGVLKR